MMAANLANVTRFELPLSPDGIEQPLADGGRVLLRPIRSDDPDAPDATPPGLGVVVARLVEVPVDPEVNP